MTPPQAPRAAVAESPSLAVRIQDAVARGDVALPPLPEVATRLMQLLQNEQTVDLATASALIANDPAIAASILRLANSASFGGLRAVEEIEQAVARLGLRQVSSLVAAIAHKGNFQGEPPVKQRLLHVLWDHAVAAGMIARRLAAQTGDDRAEAFLAGLLHDVGKLLVLESVEYLEQSSGEPVTKVVVDELMGMLHTRLGHDVLVSWKLPQSIARVALHHHDENPPPDDLLLLRVQAANAISRKLGKHTHPDPDLDLLENRAIECLQVSDLELASLMVDVEDEIAQLRSLL